MMTAKQMKAKIDSMSPAQCAALLRKAGTDPKGLTTAEIKSKLKGMVDEDPEAMSKRMGAMMEQADVAVHLADSGESLDKKVQAIRDGFYEAFNSYSAMPANCYVQEVFDGYVIVRQGEELYKANYTLDAEGDVTFDPRDQWQQVKLQYVTLMQRLAKIFQPLITAIRKAELAVTKSEADGDHPASHYLVVEDPEKPSTWHLRVKGTDGKPDHKLMGAAWAALHGGYRGNKYEDSGKDEAIAKLKKLYKSEGMSVPGDQSQTWAFTFTELSADQLLTASPKYIDGLAAGTFTSMTGEEVVFTPEELATYIENTQKIIDSTKTESGEVVGLPIDKDKHDHAGGAGWIVGLELDSARNIIRFLVNWTQDGIDLIKGNIRRFFSPSTDPDNKVILGGSLTNWPATRLETGQILLRPVELSQSIKEIDMEKTLLELLAELPGKVAEAVRGAQPQEPEPPKPPANQEVGPTLRELLNTPEAVEELGKKATEIAQDAIQAEKRKNHAVDFASRVVGGTREKPFGLRVKPADLVALLLSLPEPQAKAVEKILEQSLSAAIDFAEHGFDTQGFLNKPVLPAVILPYARDWVAAGKPIADFFKANPELGKADDYNLVEFAKKE